MDRITLLIHKSYELTGWLICHYNKQNQEFGLKETDIIRLFKGNKLLVKEDYINHLNSFYLEMKTIYYVWKNKRKSNQVACHYRRLFEDYLDVEEGRCQVMAINYGCSVFQHYKVAHNYQDLYDVVDVLNEQCGRNKKYSKYLLNSGVFIPCCCFVMQWNDFDKLCSWLFPILFAWDKKSGVNIGPEKYMEGAKCDFRYDKVDYQRRSVAFLSERLIYCFLVIEMKPFCVTCL